MLNEQEDVCNCLELVHVSKGYSVITRKTTKVWEKHCYSAINQ